MTTVKTLAAQLAAHGTQSIPLGERLPASPHSIFCSLPSIGDILAYENKEAEVCKKMQGGYPRFVNPAFTRRLETCIQKQENFRGRSLRLLSSKVMAEKLCKYLAAQSKPQIGTENSLYWLSFIDEPEFQARAQEFLQHTGAMIFSREAEDQLLLRGELTQSYPEEKTDLKEEALWQKVKSFLCEEAQAKDIKNVFLARCGMNAFFAAYQALSEIQQKKGRRLWIQLGWLYIDSMEVLKKFTPDKEDHIYLPDAQNLEALRAVLEQHSGDVAAVVTEAPTNPLLCTTNIEALAKLCKQAGAALLLDPSLVGIGNVQVLAHCDVLVSSLTKYHGWSADLIMGLAALNPESEFYDELALHLPRYIDPPYTRDLQRLAYLLDDYPKILTAINKNTMYFAEFLRQNPHIKELHWAYHEASRENYNAIAKGKERPGGVLSFSLDADVALERFYDRVSMPKGPSFGTAFHLLCPFVYLAHYDLVKTSQGRAYLKQNGLSPELLRLSVGLGKIEELCAVFEKALA